MSSTHVWKLRASEIGALLGRNKYKTTTQALADVFARHDRTRWKQAKDIAGVQNPEEIGRLALRSCGAAKDAIGSAVLTATRESTRDALKNVHTALYHQEPHVMTRTQRKAFEQRAKCAVDVAKRIIYTEIGKQKEDKGLDQHARRTGRDVGRRNNKYYRLNGPQYVIWGMIDGYDETTGTVIEHKQRQNRLFRHMPAYERVQCILYMKMTNSTRATLVQTYGDQQSTFDVAWDVDEWEAIECGLREVVQNLNQLKNDVHTRIELAKCIYNTGV